MTGLCLLLSGEILLAQSNIPAFPFLYTNGEAYQQVDPDYASIKLSISARAKSSVNAEKEFREKNLRVKKMLKDMGVKGITDSGVSKRYENGSEEPDPFGANSEPNTEPIRLAVISIDLYAKIKDLKNYSTIAKSLIESEDIDRFRVSFGNEKEKELQQQLRVTAFKEAKKKATGLCEAAGTEIRRVHAISESEFSQLNELTGGGNHGGAFNSVATSDETPYIVPQKVHLYQRINVLFQLKE